ncbi:L-threonine 3-dehydrogenase [Zooshikella marina]|uniref:L-threonine 3-dehydrogenase n=1 Tax=Zooshikella ganghwensis TaxID=202772 RepID=A0A4V1IP58_9GAMM|nr:L-threonine 3-dehydrogenase [Zooshikella ganghwensis]MBU2707825.1 L-threonine 3-dehydrogenase [Zooshikella ganghwensis]RDH46081.1 L-threonine 3-dehydrogenase [Zooshikella ganghwensis]
MKALVKSKPEPGLWMEDVPVPTIDPHEVLVEVDVTAICGTDLHIYNWDKWAQKTIPVPMHIGHEFVGHVIEVGKDVKNIKVGERVSGEGHITCDHCKNCRTGKSHLCAHTVGLGVNRPGAFAEYVSLPAKNIVKVPEDIPDEIAAIFDPLGNSIHTALSFDLIGESVFISGAGPTGLMATQIAKYIGAKNIIVSDVNEYRLTLAEKMGATHTINVLQTPLDSVEHEYDIALEMSGNAYALQTLIKNISHGGKVALLGIFPEHVSIDWDNVIFKGLHLKGIYGREMFTTWHKMLALLQSGLAISPVITHHYHIDEYQSGFDIMNSRNCGKVILNWKK